MPLYRALRDAEIKAGCILLPKTQKAFRSGLRFPMVFPDTFGETEEHAVRDHQDADWKKNDPTRDTRGASCTTDLSVAEHYAEKLKIVVRIDESKCRSLGIRRYVVRDIVPSQSIIHPEDEEVVLVSDKEDGAFPKEIVSEVIDISRR